MKSRLARLVPQPLIAILMSGLALFALVRVWLESDYAPLDPTNLRAVPLALMLALAVILAGLYPIHYGYKVKIAIITVPLYLMAVLLPLAIAPIATGLAILILEWISMSKKGNLPSDIVTAAGRWTMVALAGASIWHLPVEGQVARSMLLIVTAFVMFIGDAITCAFEIWPMTGEPPWRGVVMLVREGFMVESVQYLLGMLGALAAWQQPWALVLLALQTVIVYLAFKNAKEMREGTRKLLESLADVVDLRDPYTGGHSRRVAELAAQTLRQMNVVGPEAELIIFAARLHDIGKIGISDGILQKTGKLSPEEWEIMRAHPRWGADWLTRYPDFSRGTEFIRFHHERWDGKGYPNGMKGLDIPFGARLISVLDAFDAMTSDRPYRRAMTQEQAILVLRAGSGSQWDRSIVEALLRILIPAKPIDLPLPAPPNRQTASL
ncbi:MAG: HD-GYP domain-containing protein [Chloroflexi bacterium]|nr:HD-GYP domain-containing protein [Chloroflexota bacterium]